MEIADKETRADSLVSIIVRTKDRPKLLRRALKSISGQTYRPIEVVLVNDGGCDLDLEDAKSLLGDLSLNYIKFEKNCGRARAANAGMEKAKGEFIGFLDDDDEFYPVHVETLMTFLKQSDYKIAYADVEMAFQDYSSDEKSVVDVDKFIFSKDFSYGDLLIENFLPFNSLLFSREVIDVVGKIDESFELYEDWDFLIRAGQSFPFFHIKKITAKYNQWSRDLQINKLDQDHVRRTHLGVIEKYRGLITPAVILNLKQEKEKALVDLKNLSDRLAAFQQELDEVKKEFNLGSASLAGLKASLADKQENLERLKEIIVAKEASIAELAVANATKEARIAQLEREYQSVQTRTRDLENALSVATANFSAVINTAGWKLLERLRRLRDRMMPEGSRRIKMYRLTFKALRVLRKEGLRIFARKTKKKLKQWKSPEAPVLSPGDYEQWIARKENYDGKKNEKEISGFRYKPIISIITPVYNIEPKWLDKCIESVTAQYYENWELCLSDDCSTNRETLKCLQKWEGKDSRIKVSFGERNEGISAASNRALKMSTGDFIALLDNDDELSPDALYENVKILNTYPDTDLIYSDEDRIAEEGGKSRRFNPFFKPDWSPQLLFACMYTGHLSVYRKKLVEEVGGFRSEYDYSQDYDLALRVTERTDRIRHIEKVLYHWRAVPTSAAAGGKNFARQSNIAALRSAVQRRGYDAEVLEYPFANRVKFRVTNYPLVSIIIPTDSEKNVFSCINLLLKNTAYPRFEVVVVTNSGLGRRVETQYRGHERIKICNFDEPFNFSLKCNRGAAFAAGEYVLFLNDDVEAIDPEWLETMVSIFGKGNVGGVSPKLFYENDTIQYAGMVTGVRDLVGTAFHCRPKDSGFYFNMILSERNVSLLSGACMLMPKSLFFEAGGFDAVNTPIMHSDLDLCFNLLEKRYELIYTPFAELRHIGHLALREAENSGRIEKKNMPDLHIIKKWGDYVSADPYYTANMREFLYQNGDRYYHLMAGRQEPDAVFSKNLLFITHDLSLSGAPLLLYYLACSLKEKGYFVTVMSPCEGELSRNYRDSNIPLMIDSSIADNPLEETGRFMANFDLVVVNTIVMWAAVFEAKRLSVPAVWMVHESRAGTQMAESDSRIQEALKTADDVVFACEATESLYDKFRRKDNFRIINYGTCPIQVGNSGIRRRDDKLVLIHVGSIEPRKGQDVFIKSLAAISGKYPDVFEAYMVGRRLENDESRAFYQKIRKALNGKDNIHLLDQVPHEQIGGHLERADVFVCSSRDEVFPLTVLEAMSVGKAIVSTDVGGVSVMIKNGEEGIIVPSEDTDALSRAILRLHQNRDELERLGANAREKFNQNFTIEKFAERLLALMEDRFQL